MTRYRLFIAVVCAALVTVGCGRGSASDPVPSTLPGSYVYAARGSTLKKPWAFTARLELANDKRYKFTLDKTVDGDKDPTETSVGTYAVSGDHLTIHDSDDEGSASKDLHKLLIKGDSLIAEVGWTAEIFLKGVGAPNIVFVKERRG
ncbi:MAG: lipocalin family protein [Gemmatimonadota bacterium]|nr:lipocalin family protein [Gemmatimonadota bacterium]